MKYESIWTIKHIRNGEVIWEDVNHNSLTQSGERAILEVFFKANTDYTPPGDFYVRLCNQTLTTTSTLGTINTEPSGNGYAAQTLERSATGFPTIAVVDGVYQLTSKVLTFTAAGGQIGPVTTAYLATTSDNASNGIPIAFRALAMTRTILDGDSMTIQFNIKLS